MVLSWRESSDFGRVKRIHQGKEWTCVPVLDSFTVLSCICPVSVALWCNWLTRCPLKAESTGSIPVSATIVLRKLHSLCTAVLLKGPIRLNGHDTDLGKTLPAREYDTDSSGFSHPMDGPSPTFLRGPIYHAWGGICEIPGDFIRKTLDGLDLAFMAGIGLSLWLLV